MEFFSFEIMRVGAVMAGFELLFNHMVEGAEKNHGTRD
jgi:hypothetical protein